MKRTATLPKWALLISSLLLVGVAILSGDFLSTTEASPKQAPGVPNQLPTCVLVANTVGNQGGIGNTNLVVDPSTTSIGLVPPTPSAILQNSYSLFCPPATAASTAIPGAKTFNGISRANRATLNPAAPTCRLVPGTAGSVGSTGNTNLAVSAPVIKFMSQAMKKRLENDTSLFCPHLVIVPTAPPIPPPPTVDAAATEAANNAAATAAANDNKATAEANDNKATAEADDKATAEAKDDKATAKAKKEKQKADKATKTAKKGTFKPKGDVRKITPTFSGCGETSTVPVKLTIDIDGSSIDEATIPYTKIEDTSGCTVTYNFSSFEEETCRYNYFETKESAEWTLLVTTKKETVTLTSRFPDQWEHDVIEGAQSGTAGPGDFQQGTILIGPYFVDQCKPTTPGDSIIFQPDEPAFKFPDFGGIFGN